jgi:hypothetical protein
MSPLLQQIDKIPLLPLVIIAVFFSLAPLHPEPHLVEKLRMLFNGELVKPLDIFDLCMHATPLLVLALRLLRLKRAN